MWLQSTASSPPLTRNLTSWLENISKVALAYCSILNELVVFLMYELFGPWNICKSWLFPILILLSDVLVLVSEVSPIISVLEVVTPAMLTLS